VSGPLAGVRIIEFASIGPGPFAAMILADLGADVVTIERIPDGEPSAPIDPTRRGRRSIAVDLKSAEGRAVAGRLVGSADGLVEGYRPGVMEALGLGPDDVASINPRLVYGRMTGWGQEGPLSATAGHDIDYIAIAGVLGHIGPRDAPPVPPLNLVGDYGGGGMLLALGMIAALFETRSSQRGQVVDAAMVDGAALLMSAFHGQRATGRWTDDRGGNLLDGGAPFYGTYETKDGKYLAVGPVERRFHAVLADLAGLPPSMVTDRMSTERWPAQRAAMEDVFRTRTRDEWCEVFDGTDACVAPVLTMSEAVDHPHNKERSTFVEFDGVAQPSPAPRFSRTPGAIRRGPVAAGHDTTEVLTELGLQMQEIDVLRDRRIVR
jgi:alpha-methylacyl-CoA racemase